MIVDIPNGAALRPADIDISDLTRSVRSGTPAWVDEFTLEIPLTPEPTAAEQAAIRRRLLTRDPAHEAQVNAMRQARAAIAQDKSALATAVRLLLDAQLGSLA